MAVVVSVGCPARLTRRFTVLADPPAASAAGALPAWPADASTPGVTARPVPAPARAAMEPRRAASGAVGQTPGALPLAAPGSGVAPTLGAPSPVARPPGEGRPRLEVDAPMIRPVDAPGPAPSGAVPAAGSGAVSGPAPAIANAPVPAAGTSAPLGAGVAASAPDAAASAQARVQALEASLLALRIEARQQRESLARLESALAAAESQVRMAWMAAARPRHVGGTRALAGRLACAA